MIKQSNGPLQTVLKSLKQIVLEGFGGDDQNERLSIQTYYRTKIAQSTDPAGIAALIEWQELRIGALADHTRAIQTYAALLSEIAEGHRNSTMGEKL